MSKLSGPLLDRIDIQIEVPGVAYKELATGPAGMSSREMVEGVVAARKIQEKRFAGGRMRYNGKMSSRQIRQYCELDADGAALLRGCMTEMGLSARAHDKILRVARTIADLAESPAIGVEHLGEAVNYRLLDRQLWK
jgi:magnesium chelatase family protein